MAARSWRRRLAARRGSSSRRNSWGRSSPSRRSATAERSSRCLWPKITSARTRGTKGNTGGMGSYSDADHRLPFLTNDDFVRSLETMTKTVVAMAARGTPFKGILYGGFMATEDGPRLLEYNVRFADPESMNVLPILETDFLEVCLRLAAGNLPSSVSFARKATVCKYVVPMGYGSHPKAREQLKVDEESIRRTGARLYYASVDEKGGHLYTTTSRSLAIVGFASN